MRNKIFITFLIVGFVAVAFLEGFPARINQWVKDEKVWQNFLKKVPEPESLPGPLRGPLDFAETNLTVDGVVSETNKHREELGRNPLHINKKLNLAAQAKLDDMFRQQYFEHESPDGKRPADVIKAAGYEYIVVGENLALGNYKNDELLVQAWMDSPGHRANIIDVKFSEIGVAVGKGTYQGREVWLAVQEFGSPLSNCPAPGANQKAQIEQNRNTISKLESELATEKKRIDSGYYVRQEDYNEAVAAYNEKAIRLNKLIDDTKDLVGEYNDGVSDFNECLENNV